jgi:chaperonin GroEL
MSDKAKELIFEEEAREHLRQGIRKLKEVVGVTLGPNGRHVGLDAGWGAPKITNDGNSIVKDIELKNQYENMGASIGKEVAKKMKEKCGDGTTTSLILLEALVENGVKNVASGSSPIHIKRGMEKAAEAIVAELEKAAQKIQGEKEIAEIATASASGSKEVGEKISEAFIKVGKEGVISIEEAKGIETTIEVVEGMAFDRGYQSAYFCTNTEKRICEMENPKILVTDAKITSAHDLLPLLQETASKGLSLLIIADDIEGEALSTLVINRLRGTLNVCTVKAPGFGDRRKSLLQDIATLTGATFVTEEAGLTLKDTTLDILGSSEKVVVSKDKTTLINGSGTEEAIQQRLLQIEAEIKNTTNSYDLEKLQERKAKLSGGVALIRVGAPTEPALKQSKQLFEDSLNSTKAALEEGIVVGGGMALLRASKKVEKSLQLSKEEAIGARAVLDACTAPFRRLVNNSGFESYVYLEEVLGKGDSFGFNALTGQVEDLVKAGVRDPLKITKCALQFALSAAGVVLLSECLIGEAPEEEVAN